MLFGRGFSSPIFFFFGGVMSVNDMWDGLLFIFGISSGYAVIFGFDL